MYNILILGGNGYIGNKLIDYLLKNSIHKITVIDKCNIDNYFNDSIHYLNYNIKYLTSDFISRFDIIIFLAFSYDNLNSIIENNINNFLFILQNISPKQKFIYTSNSNHNPFFNWSIESIDNLINIFIKKNPLNQIYGLRLGSVNGFSKLFRSDLIINNMIYTAKTNNKIYLSNKNCNKYILGINDLCNVFYTIITNDNNLSGIYDIYSFIESIGNIGIYLSKITNSPIEHKENCYDMLSNSQVTNTDIFCKNFNFNFTDTLESICNDILSNYHLINHINTDTSNYNEYTIISKCNICNSKIISLIDYGYQPLNNKYTKYHNSLDKNPFHLLVENKYPLHLYFCENCFHIQLNYNIFPKFINYNYPLIQIDTKKYQLKNNKVLFIDFIPINNKDVININSLEILNNPCILDQLKIKYNNFDIILIQNTFHYLNNYKNILQKIKNLMHYTSRVYIQTKKITLKYPFFNLSHTDFNFFNSKSMNLLCKNNNLILNNVFFDQNCYIFEITNKLSPDSNTYSIIDDEFNDNIYNINLYKSFNLNCIKYKNKLQNILFDYKLQNYNIIGFNLSFENNVLLNFSNIDNKIIDFIIDEDIYKYNLFTPGSNILITSIDSFKDISQNTVIIINTNDSIHQIYNKINNKKNITYININDCSLSI